VGGREYSRATMSVCRVVNVRRLAAIEMYGRRGSGRRRAAMTAKGLNYVPLALHAVRLLGSGRLVAELAGVYKGRELRRYTGKQLWVVVPGLFVLLAILQRE